MTDLKQHFSSRGSASSLLTGRFSKHPERYLEIFRVLRKYELHHRFDKIFRFSEWIRDWYCKPSLLNVLVPLANRRPELRQLLANIVLGEREPRGYGPATMLARLLVYLVRTRPRSPAHD